MIKYIVSGGNPLKGSVKVSGAKNVALKTLVAACLTSEPVTIHNVPLISDFFVMKDIIELLGGAVTISDHSVTVHVPSFATDTIPLEKAAEVRTSSMFIAPLLAREKKAIIPNPGGCRLGARPIDRTIEGIRAFSAEVAYDSNDGFFHAKTEGLKGCEYEFEKNTHTGTETLLIASVLAEGKTTLINAAEEPEIDELIGLLNKMGARIKRVKPRIIEIEGVEKLHGATFSIKPDRNEAVTFAIAALATKGDIAILDIKKDAIIHFVEKVEEAGGGVENLEKGIRFFYRKSLKAVDVQTAPFPGFMTDWQAPWAVLMTQANGRSIIHETVFENKLGYVLDLKKMGAHMNLFNPKIENKESVYNFNLEDDKPEYFHAVEVFGPTQLHNAVVTTLDIRAGAAVVLAALCAKGESTIFGIEKLDRGYEQFEKRLSSLGATIARVQEV